MSLGACASKPQLRRGGLFGPSGERATDPAAGSSAALPSGPTIAEPVVGSEEIYGPAVAPENTAVAPVEPAPAAPAPPAEPKICLALSPGAALGFAHVGALEAILKSGLPIHCIVGSEMGALVAAIASTDLNSNNLQWQTFKIKEENYFDLPIFSLRNPLAAGKKLSARIKEALGGRDFSRLKARFAVPAIDPRTRRAVRLLDGDVADAVSAAIALPGIFEPWKMRSGVLLASGAGAEPLPISLARSLGGTFIIAIYALEDIRLSNSKNSLQNRLEEFYVDLRSTAEYQKREADYLLLPDLRAYSVLDFEKRAEIAAQGRDAMSAALERIKQQWQEHEANHKK